MPNASDNSPDHGALRRRRARVHGRRRAARRRRRTTTPRSSAPTATPTGEPRDRRRDRGPQAGTMCPARREVDAERLRRRPVRQGHRRPAALPRRPARARRADRVDRGRPAPTRASARRATELAEALQRPGRALAAKVAARAELARQHAALAARRPRSLQTRVDWGKQNLADLTQTRRRTCRSAGPTRASSTRRRWARSPNARWIGAGFPDYPWMFATDGEYTAFAARGARAVRDRSRTTCARCATSPTSSTTAPARSCTRGPDGSVWFGHDSQRTNADGTSNDFNTDETVKFPSTVALIWRWTGDNASATRCTTSPSATCATSTSAARRRPRRLARGLGNVERAGHGRRRSSTTPSTSSAALLRPRRHGARPRATAPPSEWAASSPRKLRAASRRVVDPDSSGSTRTRSTTRATQQIVQKHWIGHADGGRADVDGRPRPGLAPFDHGDRGAGAARERLLQRRPALQPRSVPHRLRRRPRRPGRAEIFSLTTSIQAVGEGNYGRLGADQQRRYTDANAEPMFCEPATGGKPDEQPGALPEILPSAPNGDPSKGIRRTSTAAGPAARCSCRRGATTAPRGRSSTSSSACGPTSAAAGSRSCRRCPTARRAIAGSSIRLGRSGSLDGRAPHTRRDLPTTRAGRHAGRRSSRSAPRSARARRSRRRSSTAGRSTPRARTTNRGARGHRRHRSGPHTLVVTAG